MGDAKDLRLLELERPWPTEPPPLGPSLGDMQERLRAVEPAKQAVFAAVDAMRDDLIRLLQELVQTPSVNPSPQAEKALADLVAGKMRELGMEVVQIEPEPNRVSNWGVYRGDGGGAGGTASGREPRTLMIYAHLDTVPAGDESAWTSPPFAAEIVDGRMIGRGAKDCKLGLAAGLGAIAAIRRAGVRLNGNIAMATPADEETGGHLGINRMIEAGLVKADYCIYGEGVPDRLTIGARGLCQVEITVTGQTTHSSQKQGGVNAIVKMAKVIEAIDRMTFTNWEPHPIVPGAPVASVNMIRGGFKENVVPDRCTILVDIRFLPGMTIQGVLSDVERVLDELRAADPYLGGLRVEARPVTVGRPVAISPDEPFVDLMATAVEDVLGVRPVPEGMVASSDSRWIVHDAGIPTVNFSMGNSSGHKPNEYIVVDEYIQNVKIYALAALLLLA